MKILVTGAAGFIGFHVAQKLVLRGDGVVGFDSVNDYYDPALKEARLAELFASAARAPGTFAFVRSDLAEAGAVDDAFCTHGPFDRVIHLAAQAGVRHSIAEPNAYVAANLVGFVHLIEACRHHGAGHLAYASTSSVYGGNTALPFSEQDGVDHPLQLYAATKRANELIAHAYSHLYRLPTTGLRFFTVYGPWGRPDMALFLFTRKILAGEPIALFNGGAHSRDFTYIDDIADGILRAADEIAAPDPSFDPLHPRPDRSNAPFRLYNIGNSRPVPLSAYVEALEEALGRRALRELLPLQPGDVPDTFADISALTEATGWRPKVPVTEGVARFVAWYRAFYGV